MTILHQNVNGLVSKSDMITIGLDELSTQGVQVDILCITEHNMIQGDEKYLDIPNFKLVASCVRDKRRGGSCILIKKHIQHRLLNDIEKVSRPNYIEISAIELLDHKINILCIYRPPNKTMNHINFFFTTLEPILSRLCTGNKKMIICGDFNIDTLVQSSVSREFVDLLYNYNLKLQFKQPTRLSSKTCIDNIAHNFKKCTGSVIEMALSDHSGQLIKCPVDKTCQIKNWYVVRRNLSREHRALFIKYIKQLTFNEIYTNNDPDDAFNNFDELFKLIYNLCFPLVKVKMFTNRKQKWLSRGIKLCSRRKRELLLNYRRKPTIENKVSYNIYSKRYKRIINLTKKSQNDYSIKSAKNKSKVTWAVINKAKVNHPKEGISNLLIDGIMITQPDHIVEYINDYFINLANNDSINQPTSVNLVSNNLPSNSKSIFMAPVIANDIIKIIRSLRSNNSLGYDGISVKIVKDVAAIIALPLCYIFNLSTVCGVFPNKLKTSIVKPIFKTGDKNNIDNYRPVAILTVFSKIYEKIIYQCVYTFFEKHNLFAPCQYGFRKNKCINMAIYNFLNRVLTNIDRRASTVAMFMDMSKAFDRVDHKILLKKMYAYGVRGNVYELMQSYLAERSQITEISRINPATCLEETYRSESRTARFGVPQGSILGPLLFLIYINDLPLITNYEMTLFADDSTILFTGDKSDLETNINKSLRIIIQWLQFNNLKINLGKTKVMNFRQRTKKIPLNISYMGTNIQETDVTKFLGLYVDSKVNWKIHVDYICKKLNQFSYALYKLKKVSSMSTLLTAYHGYVASTLRYGLIFWGNSTDKERAFKAQKRCIRSMCTLQQTDSCVPHFKSLKILTLPSLYIYESAIFVKLNIDLYDYRSRARHHTKLCIAPSNTHLLHESTFCVAIRIYNKLPVKIREISDTFIFKKDLQNLLISKCYYKLNDYFIDNL